MSAAAEIIAPSLHPVDDAMQHESRLSVVSSVAQEVVSAVDLPAQVEDGDSIAPAGEDLSAEQSIDSDDDIDSEQVGVARHPQVDLSQQLVSTPFAVRLEFFSGPMDLLLHLINQREVPVSQVCMKDVCTQYLQVVTGAASFDLEKASEFLVIAATLLAIKSRMLLPAGEGITDEESPLLNPELQDEAFYEELRARLQEYERTKLRAQALIERPQLGVDTFSRLDRKALQPTPEMLAEPEELTSLTVLFAGMLKRIGAAGRSYLVRLEPISVVGFMMKVMGSFGGPIASVRSDVAQSFRDILSQCSRGFNFRSHAQSTATPVSAHDTAALLATPRGVVIGSFIAVLELVKRGLVGVETSTESEDFRVIPRFVADGTEEERTRLSKELEGELGEEGGEIAASASDAHEGQTSEIQSFRRAGVGG